MRGVLFHPALPAAYTRAEIFDRLIVDAVKELSQQNSKIRKIDFASELIPPSRGSNLDSEDVVLGRSFPADSVSKLNARVVLYRLPICYRVHDFGELRQTIRTIITQNIHQLTGINPSSFIPTHWDIYDIF